MFRAKNKKRNIHEQIVIALALVLVVVCTIKVQLCLEHHIVSNTVTGINKLNHQESLFDMSIEELMQVTVVSRS